GTLALRQRMMRVMPESRLRTCPPGQPLRRTMIRVPGMRTSPARPDGTARPETRVPRMRSRRMRHLAGNRLWRTAATQSQGRSPNKPGRDEGDASGATPLVGEVRFVPGVSRSHRRGCILIRFLSDGDLEIVTRGEAETAGSIPCKACQPDKPVSEY